MMNQLAHGGDRFTAIAGLIGFVSLTVAVLIAHANPATAYELSIYASTPTLFWVGIGIAYLSAAVVSFSTTNALHRRLGLVLGGAGSFAIVALPLIRGYFYYGVNDPMTHAGITRELTAGTLTPYGTAYPAVHTLAAFLSGVTGFSVWQSALLIPPVIAITFFIFVPLLVRAVVGGETALVVGAFTAFLLVPIHQFATNLFPHPSSQAVLFVPIILYLIVGYLRSPDSGYGSATAFSAVVLVTIGASILLHPMQALNVILLLVAFALVGFVASRWSNTQSWWDHRSLAPVILFSVIAYVAWIIQSPGVLDTGSIIVVSLGEYVSGASPGAGAAIGTQSNSLQSIGSSPAVIYLKLFTVSTLYIVAAVTLAVAAFTNRPAWLEDSADTRRMLLSLVGGLVLTAPVFGAYLFGNVGRYYFRQASFMMVIVTILGAIAMTYGLMKLSQTRFRTVMKPSAVTVFVVLFVLSAVVFFNSPYLNLANQHVTESRIDGYQTTFDVTSDSAVISGVVQEPDRYHDALRSVDSDPRLSDTINDSELRNLQDRPGSEWYLILSRNTYEREVTAYREYRFSRGSFESLERQRGVDRVFSNGDTELYFVP
ncbi:hypothetical protein [Halapricum hydrolyticum]|uniref:Uncharacterized protein n=1 Tax=Halapricum hydrolyticum TaxID=2979991 RepID=A0AAE3ID48_9EURY|nr:hypothetical protein [Halapricum hydrolyticum]MCU4719597.1 hypothetical protein [Halapricum hydrolyticum]MCU4728107.1 hypothetical protein [Halapricum hydrolyticum]